MALHQIIYTSHARAPLGGEALIELLRHSRVNNAALGVTGLLLHADGSFMQTIEGEFDAVQRLFATIERDPRHAGIILICDEPIERRSFADWSMAFREITGEEADRVAGFRRLTAAAPDTPPDRDMARRIMATFSTGAGLDTRS